MILLKLITHIIWDLAIPLLLISPIETHTQLHQMTYTGVLETTLFIIDKMGKIFFNTRLDT